MMSQNPSLPLLSLVLAFSVATVWGFNFILVKLGLAVFQPFTLCALRFLFASLPAIFFISRPKAPWKYIFAYGLLTFALQFSLLFGGMAAGVTPGVASLIVQSQVFFAIFFAAVISRQKLTSWQITGGMVSFTGIAIIALHHNLECSLAGVLLLLSSALAWGLSAVISVKLKNVNMFSLVVWGSFIAFFPLLFGAIFFENAIPVLLHPEKWGWIAFLAIGYISYFSTYFGYGVWSWLLSRHPTASITPFALLCPIVAMISSAWLFQEKFEHWKMLSALFVIAGLCLNIFGSTIYARINIWRLANTA